MQIDSMSARLLFFIALVGLLFQPGLGTVFAQTAATPAPNAGSGHDDRGKLEQETFRLINDYRKTENLSPLKWDSAITHVARDHSHDMADGAVDFGHEGFHDRVAKLCVTLAGFRGAGENVFRSNDPEKIAQSAVAVWLKSPPHLKNIRGDYNYSGLGIWEDKDGMIYFTQIFMKLEPTRNTAQAAPPAPGISTPFGMLATPNANGRP
jgi:uncharacterized protein YkwD